MAGNFRQSPKKANTSYSLKFEFRALSLYHRDSGILPGSLPEVKIQDRYETYVHPILL